MERSVSGGEFEVIGSVEATGNSNSLTKYRLLDSELQEGLLSYRVRQVDMDGGFVYSNTVELRSYQTGLQVYPNPVAGLLYIRSFQEESVAISIIDLTGKVLFETTNDQNRIITFDTAELVPGIYLVISTLPSGQPVSRRFVKQ